MTRKALFFLFLLLFPALLRAQAITDVTSSVDELCSNLSGLLPIAAMLMTIIGAVVYASGQIMGAETRARANVWATASLTGAMMAVLITVVSPSVLGAIYGEEISCSGGSAAASMAIYNGQRCSVSGCICTCDSTLECHVGQTCSCTPVEPSMPVCS